MGFSRGSKSLGLKSGAGTHGGFGVTREKMEKGPGMIPAPGITFRFGYSAAFGLIWATVQTGSPTLNRAKRRTLRFSPSLPIFCAIKSLMANDWSLMKG